MAGINIEEYSKYRQIFTDEIPEVLLKWIKKSNWKTYLDLGCGDGSLLSSLNKEGFLRNKIVYAVDLSKNRISLVKNLNKNFLCLINDACNVKDIEDDKIDFLVSSQVIEHVESDEKMVKEIFRILKKGGTVYISTVFKKWYGWYFYKCNGRWVLDPTHLREYVEDSQLLDILKRYGFDIAENKKTLAQRSVIDLFLRKIGLINISKSNRFLKILRRFKIPLLGYYVWEIICVKK